MAKGAKPQGEGIETVAELPFDRIDLEDTTFQFRVKRRVKDLV
jgi:hypothetical protein